MSINDIKQDYFNGVKNNKIYYKQYLKKDSKAAVIIFHGFCETIEKYDDLINEFLNENMSVFIMEHRGHGRSGRLGVDDSQINVDCYMDYIEDVKIFMNSIVIPKCNSKKRFLFAHSMGGGIGAYILENESEFFDGAVLSCPMMEIEIGKIPAPIVKIVSDFYCLIGKGNKYADGNQPYDGQYDLEASGTSCDEKYKIYYDKVENNKLFQTGGASYRWLHQCMKLTDVITKKKNASKVKAPVLLFQAGKDTFVRPKGQNKFASSAKNCELVVVEEAKHELYREREEIYTPYINKIKEFYKNLV